MAAIRKTSNGYRAEVCVKRQRDSQSFRTKREADAWAARRETELREIQEKTRWPGDRITLRTALREFAEKISPTHKGSRWEMIRLASFERHEAMPLDMMLTKIGEADLTAWRDSRLAVVGPGSVLREYGLLSSVFESCRKTWKWIGTNPLREVERPKSPRHRQIVISKGQQCALLRAMGYKSKGPCRSVSQAVATCFLVALRTGMRAGELASLTWDRVKSNYCLLTEDVTKNKEAREVPLTRKTKRLIERMRGFDDELVFGLKTATLDALFRKYRSRAGLSGFTFHDTRHTAATWIGRIDKIGVLEMCRMFGWRDNKMAMVYFNASAGDIATRLDARQARGQSVRLV